MRWVRAKLSHDAAVLGRALTRPDAPMPPVLRGPANRCWSMFQLSPPSAFLPGFSFRINGRESEGLLVNRALRRTPRSLSNTRTVSARAEVTLVQAVITGCALNKPFVPYFLPPPA